jgi:two-component system sensor histidine kinase DesK
MPKIDDISRLFVLRSTSVLLLLYVVTGFAIYAESDGFTNWDGMLRWSLPLMLVFNALYTWSYVAVERNDARLFLKLLWIEVAPLVLLHFTMSEMSVLLNFVVFWIARTPQSYPLRTCCYLYAGFVTFFLLMFYLRAAADPVDLAIVGILAPLVGFFVLSISTTSINLQRERQKALDLNRELQAAQLLLAQSSRASERLRIAREIHDLLGHQMTALILNLEVSRHKTTGDGQVHVERALALGKMLLSDLRNAVSDMRENPALDFDAALAELLANIPELKVTLEREPELAIQDPQTAEVLLRCIQEALTNTLRHARASHCHICMYTQDDELVLEVRDDGKSPVQVTAGNGLKGMQERLAALAGSLHWHNDKGSFRLRARLPFAGIQP